MLVQRRWITSEMVANLNQNRTSDTPLGLYLKDRGVLQIDQLRLLFHAQVIKPVCSLFKFQDGSFQFITEQHPPRAEMTGLSLSISEATLLGLRALKDWSGFQSRLPHSTATLSKPVLARLMIHLDTIEAKVWTLSNGTLTLEQMAAELQQPIDLIQQVAFRLLSIGLVEELPADSILPRRELEGTSSKLMVKSATENSQSQISETFLHNLLGFLRSKV